jgi:AhpC/TSA antioxidant enzyme
VEVRRGDAIRIRDLVTVDNAAIPVPDPTRLTHLQFRRFAGCPICSLHLQSMAARLSEIAAAGIREVVLFHSTPQELSTYAGDLPFDVVADPNEQLYKRFGVETSLRGVLDPRAWAPALKAMSRRTGSEGSLTSAAAPVHPTGGRLELPADILIDHAGTVLACRYGRHAYDQWSVDELLALAATRA